MDLVGEYHTNYCGVNVTLRLRSNGTYEQDITQSNGRYRSIYGTWDYTVKSGYINLNKAMWLEKVPGKSPPIEYETGFIAYVDAISSQNITIVVNDDQHYYYEKVK